MKKIIILLAFLFLQTSALTGQKVYVIHGYGSNKLMMRKIVKMLQRESFDVKNYGYPSLKKDLDSIGKELYTEIKKLNIDSISFVTHSMGALVVRSMLQYINTDDDFPRINRIVMVAPPNNGAEIADFFASFKLLRNLMGPNVELMKTDSASYTQKLPIPYNSEVGVIIGGRGKKHGFNPFIKGDNDGLLTPEKTKLGIEQDIVFIKSDHNLLIVRKKVIKLMISFLRTGYFK